MTPGFSLDSVGINCICFGVRPSGRIAGLSGRGAIKRMRIMINNESGYGFKMCMRL